MATAPVQIKRYPNRRYYARSTSKYVSLEEIDAMVKAGETVEIRDSQTGENLTRNVLAQIIIERQPDKMALFPTDMLHFILRANDVMSDFLRDYFRHSLTYLAFLQKHSRTAKTLVQPMHWAKAWLDGIAPHPPETSAETSPETSSDPSTADRDELVQRVRKLEERLRQLEAMPPEEDISTAREGSAT